MQWNKKKNSNNELKFFFNDDSFIPCLWYNWLKANENNQYNFIWYIYTLTWEEGNGGEENVRDNFVASCAIALKTNPKITKILLNKFIMQHLHILHPTRHRYRYNSFKT